MWPHITVYYSNFDKDQNIFYSQLNEYLILKFWSLWSCVWILGPHITVFNCVLFFSSSLTEMQLLLLWVTRVLSTTMSFPPPRPPPTTWWTLPHPPRPWRRRATQASPTPPATAAYRWRDCSNGADVKQWNCVKQRCGENWKNSDVLCAEWKCDKYSYA